MSLRIAKLADTKPTKLTLSIDPELNDSLADYAKIYANTYGQTASVEQLAPVMLEEFLRGDTAFKRARKTLHQQPKET